LVQNLSSPNPNIKNQKSPHPISHTKSKSELPQPSGLPTLAITKFPNHESPQAVAHSTYQIKKTPDTADRQKAEPQRVKGAGRRPQLHRCRRAGNYLEMLIRNYVKWQSSKAIPEE